MSSKIGAIWARVSTEPQQTLDSQVARAREELEKRGYAVPPERILKQDWSCLEISRCPEFEELWDWVRRGEIAAVGFLDRDRLNAIGLQRLAFMADCRASGVELVICQGPPILNEPEGQLIELALAIGKERAVRRAQQGSKDALRERATVKGLPTTCQAPFGYRWDETRTRLIPTEHYETKCLIIDLYEKRATLKGIVKEFEARGMPSPSGRPYWNEATISLILKDTVNYGLYTALRRESVEPVTRRGRTYGKSSSKHLPGIPLPNIVVERFPIDKARHDWIQERLAQNRRDSTRNGKRDYLLRSMIWYEGTNLRYYGRDIRHISWAYWYHHRGHNGNPRCYLPGRKLEAQVEARARDILTSNEVMERELGWRGAAVQESISKLENERKRLDRRQNENLNAESELVNLRIRKKVSDEAYDRQLALLLAERKWISEERQRIQERLADLNKQTISLVNLDQLRQRMADRLFSDSFADRRFILEALQTKVIVTTEGAVEVEFTIGGDKDGGGIVLSTPLNACPRY